jgi:N-methylhydantoinase B/oxoprolinase/acetone carboxylase alpha subunit
MFGGKEGASGGIYIQRRGDDEFRRFSEVFGTVSDSKFTRVPVTMGDRIILQSPGGGGFGDPSDRLPELVEEDVKQGFITPEAAHKFYGYNLEAEPAPGEEV